MSTACRTELDALFTPPSLTADTRIAFRQRALEYLTQTILTEGRSVAFDLGATTQVDASGLGILVLVQKRARESGISVRLLRTPQHVRHLLSLTKLDHLFEMPAE